VTSTETEAGSEWRREAAPAALIALAVLVLLAVVSLKSKAPVLDLPWWTWALVVLPALLLTVDLALALRGRGFVRSRRAALVLLGLLVLGNLAALTLLVVALVTLDTTELGGRELLGTAFAIYTVNLIVFGLLFWELEAGGPVERNLAEKRVALDFLFPQDTIAEAPVRDWRPTVWDYLYVSLTNSIAFSPTDAMPLSLRAKAAMGLGSAISAVIILLVAARAVNVLDS
jgi:hypothetical protein